MFNYIFNESEGWIFYALITGGIGHEIALLFAQNGINIIM